MKSQWLVKLERLVTAYRLRNEAQAGEEPVQIEVGLNSAKNF